MLENALSQSRTSFFARLALLAASLAFVVVILGAFTRLTDAGLGCPDWPGCYGQLIVPQTDAARALAADAFPGQVVEPAKAWAEMTHRYIAGTLGLFIFALAILALVWRRQVAQPVYLPLCLVGLVIFQAALGMWTVTLLLLPLVVMGHLMGGMTILASLWWLGLKSFTGFYRTADRVLPHFKRYLPWAVLGLLIVIVQIALGGWTAANYSALACPDFPYCQGKIIPELDFASAFNFFRPMGINYEGGVLTNTARITINTVHRLGAVVTAVYLLGFALACIWQRTSLSLHTMGLVLALILIIQVTLGVVNITQLLPLSVAVLHNAFGALLLLTMVTILYRLKTLIWTHAHG